MECPGCNSYTSSIRAAVDEGNPCPVCKLPADAILEVAAVRNSRQASRNAERMSELVIENGRLRGEVSHLREILARVRFAVEEEA